MCTLTIIRQVHLCIVRILPSDTHSLGIESSRVVAGQDPHNEFVEIESLAALIGRPYHDGHWTSLLAKLCQEDKIVICVYDVCMVCVMKE